MRKKKPVDSALAVIAHASVYGASARDIGRACSEQRHRPEAEEALGLAIGSSLVSRGLCTITRSNRFILADVREQSLARHTRDVLSLK
jgi:hypothetical protein